MEPVYFYTLRLHFNYIIKIFSYPEERLPLQLSKALLVKNVFWPEFWKENYSLSTEDISDNKFLEKLNTCIQNEMVKFKNKCINLRNNSKFHPIYKTLNIDLDNSYINDSNSLNYMKIILKSREELLNLNFKPWDPNKIYECSMCNLNESETILHFLGKCPILSEFRRKWFNKSILEECLVIALLNGEDWGRLYGYVKDVYSYRQLLILEYNH